MLRRIRIILATLFFLSVTALFVDATGMAKEWLGWTAKIQFLPALLALNVVTVLALVVLTLLVGRAYCSVICPLGVMQDVISRISGLRKKKKSRFSYSGEKKWLRYGILVIFVVALVAGLTPLAALLAPYSSYGRMVSSVVSPSLSPVAIVAAVSFVVVAIMSWLGGRTYCNTICPVGTILGFFSRFALFRPVINTSKCNSCKRCAKKCKASCIDAKNHRIDYSRCVACMDCIKNCKHGALTFRYALNNKACNNGKSSSDKCSNENTDSSRRSFLTLSATLAATSLVKAQEKKVDGGLAAIEDKKKPERATRLVPPGAKSLRHFSQHCTACQLCVSECPNGVLRPSTNLDT
ncbi:MAG: 4Fe-4S binding protein, partial [Prevotella sp.]|nr:4Fe-4S binding protein [Prevotellaceae bacterium]MDY5343507.1 4Fe-4S binding protein [Prevotella sp.]